MCILSMSLVSFNPHSVSNTSFFTGSIGTPHTGPVAPVKPTNLTDISTSSDSATIQWTVPLIAFTPETYVVHYGTAMASLNLMSDPVESRDDFLAVNQVFSAELTKLVHYTTYYFQVTAANTYGFNRTEMKNFQTKEIRKSLDSIGCHCYDCSHPHSFW